MMVVRLVIAPTTLETPKSWWAERVLGEAYDRGAGRGSVLATTERLHRVDCLSLTSLRQRIDVIASRTCESQAAANSIS